jgi:xylulokinase
VTTSGSPEDVVLAIDLGTGGPKVVLVALSGEVIDHEHRRVEMKVLDGGGAVEDPNEWWDAVLDAAEVLRGRASVEPSRVVAVACTGQWGSTVPVDAEGRAVGDCMLWLDQRGRHLAGRQIGGRLEVSGYRPKAVLEWVRRAGGAPNPEGNDPMGHRLWIQFQEPEVYRRTATFLEPIDFINMKLTGRAAGSQATMILSWLTDNRELDRTAYDPELVALAGADPKRLPELLPIRSVVGGVLADVAERLGVPAGTPVVAGLPDLHTAALGSGAVDDLHAHMSISTSAWIGCHVPEKRTSINHQMATVPAALPGRYVLANNHDSGGASLEWLLDRVVAPDDGLGRGNPTLADLDAVAAGVAPGAGGVMFVPWLKGERSPVSDTLMRASWLNLGIDSGRPEMVRAVLEGVAHQMRWLLDTSEKVVKGSLGEPRVIGGGAQSDVWCQIHADVIGRPLHRVADPLLASSRGAALFAGLVIGRLKLNEMEGRAPMDRVFRPDPAAKALHAKRHKEFLRLHRAQRGLYHRLNR